MSSLQHLINDTPPDADADADAKLDPLEPKAAAQPPLRSWRKKYRKLRLRFDKVMDDSNSLFKEEHRALALARRLQEENGQLLEMLLDLHESNSLLERHEPALLESIDIATLTNGSSVVDDDDDTYLSSLLEMPHRTYTLNDVSAEVKMDNPAAYMDSAYEDEYLENLDSQLADPLNFMDTNRPLRVPASRMLPSDKDLSNQNSDSVLSWLRRHHPETFIQEKDHPPEKPAPRPRGSGKRSSLAQTSTPALKAEPADDIDEEELLLAKEPEKPTTKGKKSKGDEPYRPKGGSSRASKRKREDGDAKPAGRGKRAKAQAASTPKEL